MKKKKFSKKLELKKMSVADLNQVTGGKFPPIHWITQSCFWNCHNPK